MELAKDFPPLLQPSVREMREHLSSLMPGDFLLRTPWQWLEHFPRYLAGISARLTKLRNAGLARDRTAASVIEPLWRRYLDRREKHRLDRIDDPALAQFRWMLEELRIQQFAQELKTAIPVSVQRLESQWTQVVA
jgi:ATP-dependent helicase HrpA